MSLYFKGFVFFILFSTLSYSATVTEEISMLKESINDLHLDILNDMNKSGTYKYDVEKGMNKSINSITGFFALIGTSAIILFRRYMKSFKKDQLKLLKEYAVRLKYPKATDKEIYEHMRGISNGK